MTTEACGRKAHAIALDVARAFLSARGIRWQMFGRAPGHLAIHEVGGRTAVLLVRGGKIQRREHWSSTTPTWLKRDRVIRLADWQRVQFGRGRAFILFVLRATRHVGPGCFQFCGAHYHLLVVPAAEYAARMQPRSISWDDKVQISAAEFRELATPLAEWLENSVHGVNRMCHR